METLPRSPAALAALVVAVLALPAAAQFTDRPYLDRPLGDHPRIGDPEAHDAVDLFSRLCVSTRGDRSRAIEILGDGDSAIEKLDERTVRQFQGGRVGGAAWTIRMPLGEKLIVEFEPSGSCIVRAPRVDALSLEDGLRNFLAEIAANGEFKVRRAGDDEKTVDKRKYHLVTYSMRLPDTDQKVEVAVATTEAKDAFVQGSLTYEILAGGP